MLFDKDRTVWKFIGYSELNHVNLLHTSIGNILTHIRSLVELNSFGSNRIDLLLNDQVKQCVINQIIIIKMLTKTEKSFNLFSS